MDMVVCYTSTFFKHEKRHLVKYDCGGDRSEIDLLMMRKADRRLVKNVKVKIVAHSTILL